MKQKMFWIPYRITEPAALESFFERMARRGWLPVDVRTYTGLFRQAERSDRRFCLDFPQLEPGEEARADYIALCGEFGWEFCCEGKGWLLFSTADPEAIPLQSDPKMAAANFRKDFLRRFWNNLDLFSIFAAWLLGTLFFRRNRFLRVVSCWDSALNMVLGVLALLLPILLLAGAFSSLSSYGETQRAMKQGRPPRPIPIKKAARRIWFRQAAAGIAGGLLLGAVAYDIWGGTFRPAPEQWAAMAIGLGVLAASPWIPWQWGEGIPRRFAAVAGGVFLALGLWLAYPANRLEPVSFTADDPVIQAEDFLPGGELTTNQSKYGHSPLYEKWEVYQWSQAPGGRSSVNVSTTSYRSATPAIAALLAEEELKHYEQIFGGLRQTLDWPGCQGWRIESVGLVLRQGRGVIRFFLGDDDPEEYRALLLETLEELLQKP